MQIMLKTSVGTVFAKVIQCFEKSNTRMNTKHSEKKSNTKKLSNTKQMDRAQNNQSGQE